MRKEYGVLVGLDVQPNSLNLVALVSDGKSLRLSGADHRILPAGVIEQGNWRNREPVSYTHLTLPTINWV